jgi:hypothetical protein
MNTEKIENELRQLFGELRANDSQRVPSFYSVTRASSSTTSTPRKSSPWFRFLSATAVLVLLIAGIALAALHSHTRSFEREMQRWAALSDWETPTDTLLSISETPWGSAVPMPSDSLIDANTADLSDTTIKNQ